MRTVRRAILRPRTRRRFIRIHSSPRHRSRYADPNIRHGKHIHLHSNPSIPVSTAILRAAAPPRLQAPSNILYGRRPNNPASRGSPPQDKAAARIPAEPGAPRARILPQKPALAKQQAPEKPAVPETKLVSR